MSLAAGQTSVDLRTQDRGVNFTADFENRHVVAGDVPARELFFKIELPPIQTGLGVTWLSGQTLSIGSGRTIAISCAVRFGNTTYSIQSGATATVSGGNGAGICLYFERGSNYGRSQSDSELFGLRAPPPNPEFSEFPSDSVPLFTWSSTSGLWEATGGVAFPRVSEHKKHCCRLWIAWFRYIGNCRSGGCIHHGGAADGSSVHFLQ